MPKYKSQRKAEKNKTLEGKKLNRATIASSKARLIFTASEPPSGTVIRKLRRALVELTFTCHMAETIAIKTTNISVRPRAGVTQSV
jgi:hypothetical protein